MKKLFSNKTDAQVRGQSATKAQIEIVRKKRSEFLKRHKNLVQVDSEDYDEMMMLNNQANLCLICIETDAEARGRIK